MERERIKKAAQLADDHNKVTKALALMDGHERVAIRISATVGGGNSEETLFAYLPKSILPGIRTVLQEALEYISNEMEDL